MTAQHLPILQIIIPLLAAPLCLLLRQRVLAWLCAASAACGALLVAALLLSQVVDEGAISYALGNWPPPWGIELRVDLANAYVLLLVTAVGVFALFYAPASLYREVPSERHYLLYALFMLCLTGLLGIVITGDVFNLFVFLEISSLSTYAMVSLGRDRRALTAAYQYLVMGTIGGTFVLIGVGLIYMKTGTLNMQDLSVLLAPEHSTSTVLAAFAFLGVGIGLKQAFFPLHLWLPNAYTYAPSAVTVFIAATATKVSVYMFARFAFTVFGSDFVFGLLRLDFLLLPLSVVGIFVASTVAIFQDNAKRMLAYSSIAQIGYIMLGFSLASVAGLTASIVHMFNHALMKGALFMALGCVAWRLGSIEIEAMRGLGKRMPFTAAALVLGGLSLIGVPSTTGFISKWNLILATLEKGLWPIAVLILLSSLLAVIYIWRLVEAAYFRPCGPDDPTGEAPLSLLVPLWCLIAANLFFGLSTSLTLGIAQRAAQTLMGVAL